MYDLFSGGLEPPNRSAGILGPAPMSSGPAPGLGSGWGEDYFFILLPLCGFNALSQTYTGDDIKMKTCLFQEVARVCPG